MTNYFKACRTIEDVKKLYKELVKQLHPDLNGQDFNAKFIEMKNQYDKASEQLRNVHANKEGKLYEKENNEDFGLYASMIERLVIMQGVKVEICGTWIWCSLNTKPYKEILKEMGFKWSKNKLAWYYHSDEYVKKGNKRFALDEIREMFGNKVFENQSLHAIN